MRSSCFALLMTGGLIACQADGTLDESDTAYEATQTQKLLGVPVKGLSPPQGGAGFDELSPSALALNFTLAERALSGQSPRASYEPRESVLARGPDGSIYEAFLGYDDPKEIIPGHGFVSTPANTRQRYDTHHGYSYNPQNVFIGKRVAGRLKPTLFFRDVGSHTTAPHAMAVDGKGRVHLAVADVNISQDNNLDLYWATGDPESGRWKDIWLIDHRGFTSWSRPWMAASGERVHLLWTWCDATVNRDAPGMGLFHVESNQGNFRGKRRLMPGVIEDWSAAMDPQGRLLIAVSKDDGVHVISGDVDGSWTRPARLQGIQGEYDVSVDAAGRGTFVIRTVGDEQKEWVLSLR